MVALDKCLVNKVLALPLTNSMILCELSKPELAHL